MQVWFLKKNKKIPHKINRRYVKKCISNVAVHIQPQADVAKKILDIVNMTVHFQTVCCIVIFQVDSSNI